MQVELTQPAIIEEFLPLTQSSGIEKAEVYAATFAPFMIKLKELSDKAAMINKVEPTQSDAKIARQIRLDLVKNRTATTKQKDTSKQALLAEGNLIQGLHNIVINTSNLIEPELESIEKHAENKEKERKQAIAKERAKQLSPYLQDLAGYDLANMDDNIFSDLLESQRMLHEKRIEDAKREEAERISREAEDLRKRKEMEAENERMKKQIEEAERLAKIEREKAEKELAAAKKEAERVAAELKKKQDDERAEAERLAKIEREKTAAAKKAAKAPDKIKIQSAIDLLPALNIGDLKTDDAILIANEIKEKFTAFKAWANQKIQTL